ncbi:MAG: hypothetical protein JSV63_00230 [Candidatus Aenigmatarchaeota archaeon]|nr:MAG: hypothetical protein JSV63_00230 [Candidatus Aenigmarchaeota archaeon]
MELLEGQSLKLEAVARLGTGLAHAKHHAANASYHYHPVISVTGSRADAQKALKLCPKDIVTLKGKRIEVKDLTRSDSALACLRGAKGIEVKGDESKIVFNVESISGLEPGYIVSRAAEILEERAGDFKKKLEKV